VTELRRRFGRPFLAAGLAAAIALSPVAASPVVAQGSDANTAVAVNDKDGSSVFDVAFQIRRVSSGVVDHTNAAVAYASCEACQTVAIAIQIVLVSGTADTITPTNLAIALNEQCTTCQTMALAYQYVFGTGDVIGLTPEGRRRLKEIRKAVRELARSELSLDEINARLPELTDQIADVLATEVVVRGPLHEGTGDQEDGDQSAEEETTPDETVPEETVPQDEALDEGAQPPEDELPEDSEEPVPPESDTGETETAPSSGGSTSPDDSTTTSP
jgi:putative peptide zinc metalloprotease protein